MPNGLRKPLGDFELNPEEILGRLIPSHTHSQYIVLIHTKANERRHDADGSQPCREPRSWDMQMLVIRSSNEAPDLNATTPALTRPRQMILRL